MRGLLGVKMRNIHPEQMFSASPPTTDIRQLPRNDRFVPQPEIVVVCSLRRLR